MICPAILRKRLERICLSLVVAVIGSYLLSLSMVSADRFFS